MVYLRAVDEGEIELRVGDDGVGLPGDFDTAKTESLGLQLVMNFAEYQLGGTVEIKRESGTEFVIRVQRAYGRT